MKKLVLALAVVFTLGMVACGNKEKAENENGEEVPVVEEVVEEGVVTETPQGDLEAAGEEVEAAAADVQNAAAQTTEEVKTKSQSKVQEVKEKAKEAVDNAAEKTADAIDGAAQTVADKAKETADKVKKLKK